MWNLNSLTRDQTHTSCIGKCRVNHWTTREVPDLRFYDYFFKLRLFSFNFCLEILVYLVLFSFGVFVLFCFAHVKEIGVVRSLPWD